MNRPSRGERASAATMRYWGCFFLPTRVRRSLTAMGAVSWMQIENHERLAGNGAPTTRVGRCPCPPQHLGGARVGRPEQLDGELVERDVEGRAERGERREQRRPARRGVERDGDDDRR